MDRSHTWDKAELVEGGRESDYGTPLGGPGTSAAGGSTFRVGKRSRKDSLDGVISQDEGAKSMEEAVDSADKDLKMVVYELSKFLTAQRSQLPNDVQEFLQEWNRRAAATMGTVRKLLWQLQGQCMGLSATNRDMVVSAVQEALQGTKSQTSLSPVVRSMERLEKGVAGLADRGCLADEKMRGP
ncbi:unnamed protein product [Nesidiocoris tenuis]|uniref:Uncharacterized protein n=1 Tax=Nesidiocoris tenuis TaxID=355587 RepID=A0A6H5G5H2_9HEMI|nr:unnamed protein product [Nesidiocoris tenuis]